jgi:hypothetical protein
LGDPYVVLTSANLDPLFGLQTTDANDVRDAMVAIYRYVALPSSGETVSVAYF